MIRILIILLPIAFHFNAWSQIKHAESFSIKVIELGPLFAGNSYWTITNDSISVLKKEFNNSYKYVDTFPLPKQMEIVTLLNRIDFMSLKDTADNFAPDDMQEYDFEIILNGQSKKFRIHQVKIESVFVLVKKLNELLPKKFDIGYNEAYFRHKN